MEHRDTLRAQGLAPDAQQQYRDMARESIAAQARLEADTSESFSSYVERYHAALKTVSE